MLIVWVVVFGMCGLASCAEVPAVRPSADTNTSSVDSVLEDLHSAAENLRTYQCKLEYLFSQPVLESKTLRKGTLQYARFNSGSKLRIGFDTLVQDDGPPQKYVESYVFDGQWLTHIDYQIKQVRKKQLAEANEPVDAFELAKRNFPIIGFDKTEDLKRQFESELVGETNGIAQVHLKVRPDSEYADEYESADIWIDEAIDLPSKLVVVSTEGDIYEISFIEPKVDEPISEKVFEVTIPAGFGKPEIIPLKKVNL